MSDINYDESNNVSIPTNYDIHSNVLLPDDSGGDIIEKIKKMHEEEGETHGHEKEELHEGKSKERVKADWKGDIAFYLFMGWICVGVISGVLSLIEIDYPAIGGIGLSIFVLWVWSAAVPAAIGVVLMILYPILYVVSSIVIYAFSTVIFRLTFISPSDTIRAYFEAMKKGDFEKAADYCYLSDPEELRREYSYKNLAEYFKEMNKTNPFPTDWQIDVLSEESLPAKVLNWQEYKAAEVKYKLNLAGIEAKEESVVFIKKDGYWKIPYPEKSRENESVVVVSEKH